MRATARERGFVQSTSATTPASKDSPSGRPSASPWVTGTAAARFLSGALRLLAQVGLCLDGEHLRDRCRVVTEVCAAAGADLDRLAPQAGEQLAAMLAAAATLADLGDLAWTRANIGWAAGSAISRPSRAALPWRGAASATDRLRWSMDATVREDAR